MAKIKAFQAIVLVAVTLVFFGFLYYFDFFAPAKIEEKPLVDTDISAPVTKESLTEKTINRYLTDELVQETLKNSVIFCSHEILASNQDDLVNETAIEEVYIYAICEEFVAGDVRLKPVSGFSGPVLLAAVGGEIVSRQQPRDGNFYTSDIEAIFPASVRVLIDAFAVEKLVNMNRFKARDFFSYEDEYKIVEQISETCSRHSDCSTPPDYLLRSDCPYESRCIDEICTVVCPVLPAFLDESATSTDDLSEIGSSTISSFKDCEAAGQPIMESFPRQCSAPDGTTYTEVLDNLTPVQ